MKSYSKKRLQTKKIKVYILYIFFLVFFCFGSAFMSLVLDSLNKCLISEFICHIMFIITITWGPYFKFFLIKSTASAGKLELVSQSKLKSSKFVIFPGS